MAVNAGYTRRQELYATLAEAETYAAVVLYPHEVIYIEQSDGRCAVKIGDGVTPLGELPYVVNYSDISSAASSAAASASDALADRQAAAASAEAAATSASNAKAAENAAKANIAAAEAEAVAHIEAMADQAFDIKQETGTSETAVISQAASSKIFAAHDSRITRNSKRLDNIEAGIPADDFIVDATAAEVKDVPEGVLPLAKVVEIGGLTRKCANLVQPRNDLQNWGCSVTIASDGKITLTSTSGYESTFARVARILLKANTEYTISLQDRQNVQHAFLWKAGETQGEVMHTEITYTPSEDQYFDVAVYMPDSSTVGSVTSFYLMINSGSTALPYEPYFEGLRSAKATEMESLSANLLYLPDIKKEVNGVSVEVNNGVLYLSGTGTQSGGRLNSITRFTLPSGTYVAAGHSDIYLTNSKDNGVISQFYGQPFTLSEETTITVGLTVRDGVYYSGEYYLMLNEGTTALEYTPYTRNTLPIPVEVQEKDGYGIGLPSVPNSIRWEDWRRTWNKRCGVADMGTLAWNVNAIGLFYANVSGIVSKYSRINLLCGAYDYRGFGELDSMTVDKSCWSNQSQILVKDTDYTDAASFKAAVSGVMLVYELATPITVDISDILPADNLLPVEGGGTVTMVSEYGYDVPSEIVYQIDNSNESEVSA